jgi:hypothetical protein
MDLPVKTILNGRFMIDCHPDYENLWIVGGAI